jgi:hypothetical protein
VLILAGIGALMLSRLTLYGDNLITYILPNMPISGFGWIDYLTLLWVQFLLLYFVYCAYGNIVRKWQVAVLLAYSAVVSLCVVALPFEVIASAYNMMNIILLLVIAAVTAQLGRAVWRGQPDATGAAGRAGVYTGPHFLRYVRGGLVNRLLPADRLGHRIHGAVYRAMRRRRAALSPRPAA